MQLTGREGVPVIDIGGEIIEGWGPGSEKKIEQKITQYKKARR